MVEISVGLHLNMLYYVINRKSLAPSMHGKAIIVKLTHHMSYCLIMQYRFTVGNDINNKTLFTEESH